MRLIMPGPTGTRCPSRLADPRRAPGIRARIDDGVVRAYARSDPPVAEYHSAHQPPALVLWGRHDAYFDVDRCSRSIARWTRMDAHLFDGGHLLLETHAAECAALLRAFVRDHS
ncbi:alpha/beta fold hydrolase [Micromonospora chalcea]|uniref:alpha/beta fold hydrolase n=1 Tax=Micromonospora chalcea TaxID=1874 RepID=UPI003D7320FB